MNIDINNPWHIQLIEGFIVQVLQFGKDAKAEVLANVKTDQEIANELVAKSVLLLETLDTKLSIESNIKSTDINEDINSSNRFHLITKND